MPLQSYLQMLRLAKSNKRKFTMLDNVSGIIPPGEACQGFWHLSLKPVLLPSPPLCWWLVAMHAEQIACRLPRVLKDSTAGLAFLAPLPCAACLPAELTFGAAILASSELLAACLQGA